MAESIETVVLDRKAAAASLRLSLRMLDSLVKAGAIKTVRVGDRVLFRRQALEDFARRSEKSRKSG